MTITRPARIPELRLDPACVAPAGTHDHLLSFIARHRRVAVVTGAGCSTRSGIPAYRDASGQWLRRSPVFYQDFLRQADMRRRYWARSFFGWPRITEARPGAAHEALARLSRTGHFHALITQNVDGLHQRAGQPRVIELHGGLDRVKCLNCETLSRRDDLQQRLNDLNPDWNPELLGINPDGDAELDERAYPGFRVADCGRCGGLLKPDVVFFGESVPRRRLEDIDRELHAADALLLVGTSMVVWSGFRLARQAAAAGLPIAAINEGRTRADGLLDFKLGGDCGEVLGEAARAIDTTLAGPSPP